jgi:hypothetical protein
LECFLVVVGLGKRYSVICQLVCFQETILRTTQICLASNDFFFFIGTALDTNAKAAVTISCHFCEEDPILNRLLPVGHSPLHEGKDQFIHEPIQPKDVKSAGGAPSCIGYAVLFLTAIGADEAQIETSFCAAINTAKEQKCRPSRAFVHDRVPSSRYRGSPVSEFQEILFLNVISAVIVGETRNSLWNATVVRRRGARQAFTPRAGGSS